MLSCCFPSPADLPAETQAVKLELATNGNIVVQLDPNTDITQFVDAQGNIILENLRFRHLLILDLASETRPSLQGEDKEHPEWYTTAGFSLMHSSYGKVDATQGTTRHTPEKALEHSHNGLAHNTLVFRCIDPELLNILQDVAATWATRPKSVAFNPRNTRDHIPSAALYRSVRAYSREQKQVPLSNTQGVSCDCFVGYCLQISILHRLFPAGVPQALLDYVKRIEFAKAEMGLSKFATMPGIERDLRAMVALFDKLLTDQPPKLDPKLVAKFKEILLYTAKSHIGNFQKMLLGCGLFECSGVAVISPDMKLATLSGADLGRVRTCLAETVQREAVPKASQYVMPFPAEYIQPLARDNERRIAALQVLIPGKLGDYIDGQEALYQEAEVFALRRRILISTILSLKRDHPANESELHELFLKVRDEKDFKAQEYNLWQQTQAYVQLQGWPIDVMNLSCELVATYYKDVAGLFSSRFSALPRLNLPHLEGLPKSVEAFQLAIQSLADVSKVGKIMKDFNQQSSGLQKTMGFLQAEMARKFEAGVPEHLTVMLREIHQIIERAEDPRQDLRDQSYVRYFLLADSRIAKLTKAIEIASQPALDQVPEGPGSQAQPR